MPINLEQIDLLRKRAKVSYSDAKAALEKCNNDIVEALVYLEEQNKTKDNQKCKSKIVHKIKHVIKKCNSMKFIIKKSDHTIINLPLTIIILIGIAATPFFIIGILAALLTKHKIIIKESDGNNININEIIGKMTCSTDTEKKSNIDLDK